MQPIRSIVESKSKPWNMLWWKCLLRGRPVQHVRVFAPHVLPRGDEEPGGAAGRVADFVVGLRAGHLDHQRDDVARRAELAVLSGRGDLAEHVLVEVALGVAPLHRQVADQVDDLREQAPASGS